MDRNYKLLITSSLVALMATGCSSFGQRGNTDPQTSLNSGTSGYAAGQQQASSGVVTPAPVATTCGQCAINQAQNTAAVNNNGRTQQWYVDQWNRQQAGKQTPAVSNGRSQQWYIDQYNRSQAAAKAKAAAATTTTNGRSQQWYIDQYNRQQAAAKAKAAAAAAAARAKPAPVRAPAPVASNGRTKQWYVDQWNRQQAAAKKQPVYTPPRPVVVQQPTYVAPAYVPPKPVVAVKPYVPPAPAPVTKTTTTYVDYTNGAASNATSTVVAPSNKSLYTGSFQQPRQAYTQYTPKTYTGGAGSSNTTYSTPAVTTSAGGNTYVVKKGDTVFEVMRQTGVYWKEIISMNNLQAPSYTIQPGQRLRLK